MINVSPSTPIPHNWLAQSTPYSGPVPADAVIVDCAEAASCAAAWNAPAPPPDSYLTEAQLVRKIPAMKDLALREFALTQLGFPRAWRESQVDKWLAQMRERAKQIQQFI